MIVMPANATGWFWHCLARETGRIGHLYSPGAQRGPRPWFPFALDNGAYSCWDISTNVFNHSRWNTVEPEWIKLLLWASTKDVTWAIVPDVIGNREMTLERFDRYYHYVADMGIVPAIAVQDGMIPSDISSLKNKPEVICVGGTTKWKWETVETWCWNFERVHVLRCNSPSKLYYLESLGVESCDGTGWNRGDRTQTAGVETWARMKAEPKIFSMSNFVCRGL